MSMISVPLVADFFFYEINPMLSLSDINEAGVIGEFISPSTFLILIILIEN